MEMLPLKFITLLIHIQTTRQQTFNEVEHWVTGQKPGLVLHKIFFCVFFCIFIFYLTVFTFYGHSLYPYTLYRYRCLLVLNFLKYLLKYFYTSTFFNNWPQLKTIVLKILVTSLWYMTYLFYKRFSDIHYKRFTFITIYGSSRHVRVRV